MKICSFGSLNLDHVYRVKAFVRPGETISARSQQDVCGGKGLNQSIAMARAGAKVYQAGNIGQDEARKMLKSALENANVHTDYLRALPMQSGHTIIQVSDEGENAIICFGGSNQAVDDEQAETGLSAFQPGDLLVLQNEINHLDVILRIAREKGMKIAMNPSPITEGLEKLPLENCDILFVNELEAAYLCGSEKGDLQALAGRFPHAMLVFTQGSRGAQVWHEGKVYTQNAYKVRAVDTTGAGDTFTGYFLTALCEGKDIQDCMKLAAKASAISVSRPGASVSIPLRDEVDAFRPGE